MTFHLFICDINCFSALCVDHARSPSVASKTAIVIYIIYTSVVTSLTPKAPPTGCGIWPVSNKNQKTFTGKTLLQLNTLCVSRISQLLTEPQEAFVGVGGERDVVSKYNVIVHV